MIAPEPPTLIVRVVGGVSISWQGHELDIRNRKARAIVAYLALSDTGEEPRERLAGLFWSEAGETQARATLRQAVHEIRHVMAAAACPALIGTRTGAGLLAGSFTIDIAEILTAVAAGHVPDAMMRQARTTETLLAGYDDLDPAFHAWLIARRQTLHDRLMRGLEDGYRNTALPRIRRGRLAEAAFLLDPTHEEACRAVMQTAAEDGDLGSALHAYDSLYRILGDDYDMEPSIATQTLVAEIKQGKFDVLAPEAPSGLLYEAEMRQALVAEQRAAEPTALPAMSAKPALFVDRFSMSGVAADQAHLVDGFRIELIGCLSRFREWYVTSAERDLAVEPSGVPVLSRYTVTTTAYQGGTTINVVMVLQEHPSNLAIWGERFELSLESWSEAQQRIVRRIAAALKVQLSVERLSRISHMPDGSLEAHDIWLRSQSVISGFKVAEWNRAAQMLARAIEREPGFSPLYSALSQMNNVIHFVQPGLIRDEDHVRRTLSLAQRAVALDPRDSRAQLCLGWALTFCHRHSQAELHMEIACELNSNDSQTLMSSAGFYCFKGDTDRAMRQAAMALEMTLAPTLSHWSYMTNIRFLHGDYEGTIVAADRAQDGLITMLAFRAAALSKLGRMDEAKQDLDRFFINVRAAWIGGSTPTDAMIAHWLLHLYPISRPEVWLRLRDGMALAGLPVTGLTYHG